MLSAASVLAVAGACAACLSSPAAVAARSEGHPQTTWAACNRNAHNKRTSTFRPLSDQAAASLVTHQRETRPYNAKPYTVGGKRYPAANYYVPTSGQLRRFRSARLNDGSTQDQFDPYFKYVDGRDGLRRPSTDDLIQWSAHKWGIPEDWLRAEYVQESYWNDFQLGDQATVSSAWYRRYPSQARVPGSLSVYQSMGITQDKWIPDGSQGAGTEPLRWESTAFNLDYQAAVLRFYYDNPAGTRSAWGDSSYAPCEQWNSIGGWFEPYPWGNSSQEQYIAKVQQHLRDREWTTSSFIDWSPGSFPPGVKFR